MSKFASQSIGRDAAIKMYESKWWVEMEARDIFECQLRTKELCMDWSAFHEAAEAALGRPVWTHEFACPEKLWDEYEGRRVVRNPVARALETLSEILNTEAKGA